VRSAWISSCACSDLGSIAVGDDELPSFAGPNARFGNRYQQAVQTHRFQSPEGNQPATGVLWGLHV
jgi:hypothetical protein